MSLLGKPITISAYFLILQFVVCDEKVHRTFKHTEHEYDKFILLFHILQMETRRVKKTRDTDKDIVHVIRMNFNEIWVVRMWRKE